MLAGLPVLFPLSLTTPLSRSSLAGLLGLLTALLLPILGSPASLSLCPSSPQQVPKGSWRPRVSHFHSHQDGSLRELRGSQIVLEIVGTRGDRSCGAEMKLNSARGRGGKDAVGEIPSPCSALRALTAEHEPPEIRNTLHDDLVPGCWYFLTGLACMPSIDPA